MFADLSLLKTVSAMARHAAHGHSIHGENIARADIPNSTSKSVMQFTEYLSAVDAGSEVSAIDTGRAIAIDQEMSELAQYAGRHQTATTLWSKTIDLLRLAGAAPR